ncbi:transposase family protein [Saccharopolyspora pogona]|uniref:transposase family protein n=1 Tax=Saccharopolyspora pogona TaxID=333966 RepID=UPI0016875B19|nr:transposase family protein [Saccharopolyspora pogona]
MLAVAERPDPLLEAGLSAVGLLVELLAGVPDPRDPRGVRHTIGAVLSVMVFAVLAGARNFREIADQAVDLPVLLAAAGCRLHPVTGRYVVPSEPTMRRLAHDIDADAADARVCQWMREQAMAAAFARRADGSSGSGEGADAGVVAVAMDGKVVRNTIAPSRAEGSEIKLFSALLHERRS